MLVISGSARVCLFAELRRLFPADAVTTHQLFDAIILVRVDKDPHQIGAIAQNLSLIHI